MEPYFAFNQKRDAEYSAIDKNRQVKTDKCSKVVLYELISLLQIELDELIVERWHSGLSLI